MRRGAAVAVLAVALAGLLGALAVGASTDRDQAFSLGTFPAVPLATLEPGDRMCQTPLTLPEPARLVRLVVAPGAQVRGPVVLTAREPDGRRGATGRVLAEATLTRRLLTGQPADFVFDRPVPADRVVSLCARNAGDEALELWGDRNTNFTPSNTEAVQDGESLGGDLYLVAPERPRSVLSRLPEVFERAATFKLGGMGAWTFWLLAAVAALGVPLLLARALTQADQADR